MTERTDGEFIRNAVVLYAIALLALVAGAVTIGLAIGLALRAFHYAAGG